MRTALATVLAAVLLTVVAGAAFIYSGAFNVAASDPHSSVVHWVMEKTRMRSIQVAAADHKAPAGYDEETKVAGAVGHFSEHCAACHGGPGTKRAIWAEGMYPLPPNLKEASSRYTGGELFWILKNGIKMSGMPAMASDGDEMLWSTVAFLEKLPAMTDEQYNDLWMMSQMAGSHGGMDHGAMNKDGGMDHSAMPMHGALQPAAPDAAAKPANP